MTPNSGSALHRDNSKSLNKLGIAQHDYQPDFVAEATDCIYMLEPKAKNEMTVPEVLAKKDAAVLWCNRATAHSLTNGGNPGSTC